MKPIEPVAWQFGQQEGHVREYWLSSSDVGRNNDMWVHGSAFVPIPVIRDFGVVSSISVAFSLVLALLVLPGLLAAEVRTERNST